MNDKKPELHERTHKASQPTPKKAPEQKSAADLRHESNKAAVAKDAEQSAAHNKKDKDAADERNDVELKTIEANQKGLAESRNSSDIKAPKFDPESTVLVNAADGVGEDIRQVLVDNFAVHQDLYSQDEKGNIYARTEQDYVVLVQKG